MENYKIKVNNEAESKEVQELFFELGYYWATGLDVKNLDARFLYVSGNLITMGYCSIDFSNISYRKITIAELRDLVASHRKPTEQALISGADALRALADGKEVEHKANKHMPWGDASLIVAKLFSNTSYQFRIKPRTIKLALEIPAPFEPKDNENFYVIDCDSKDGYRKISNMIHSSWTQFGAWRTESEIKQVVAALREAIKLA